MRVSTVWLRAGLGLTALFLALGASALPAAPPLAASAATPPSAPQAQSAPLSFEASMAALTAFEWPWVVVRDGPIGAQHQVGLQITVVETDARSVQALLGGSVDIAETSMDAVARAVEQGADIVAIGGVINRPPYALAVRPNIASYNDLRGRRIAVTDLRGGSTVVLRRMLAANGLGEADIDMVPLGGTPNRYTALTSGAVDAAILAQPADFRAADEGYRLLDYTTDSDFQFTVYTVRRSWAAQNRDKVLRFMRATVAAHRWLHDAANREPAIALGMQVFRTDRQPIERTWDLYFRDNPGRVIPREAEFTMPGIDAVLRALAAEGELRDSGNPTRFIDDSFRQEALRAN